jgi:hypothetical protein
MTPRQKQAGQSRLAERQTTIASTLMASPFFEKAEQPDRK